MSFAIETKQLSKSYGPVQAVSELSLTVEPGQVFGFLGPNGAGKSTTIRMLMALQRASSGEARVLGLDPQRDDVELHRRVSYLPGDLELFARMTGRHHTDVFAQLKGGADAAFIKELAERFQVVMDRPARELSKGNRQKIGLVMAFMTKPELLILDEPTTGLDPLMQHEFERLLRETVRDGRTVFLSSHDLDEVQRVTDRIAIIKQGRMVAVGIVDDLAKTLPRQIEARFARPVSRTAFESLPGVKVTAMDGTRVALEITGDIAPVIRAIAAHEPVDVLSRHANLEELFLNTYRPSVAEEVK